MNTINDNPISTPLPEFRKITTTSTIMDVIDRAVRRAMDFSLALIGLIFLSPLFLLLAILIKKDSPGPIFYRSWRAGRHNRNFLIIKFRTMYEEPESYQGQKVTAQDDPRITLVGRWLRSTKLNELPQLFNVFKGEMSLVGPRPEDPHIVAKWPEAIRQEILSARPGITSPASVVFRHEERMLFSNNVMDKYLWDILPSKLRLDQIYVRSRNILTDLDVLFWTFFVLLPGVNGFTVPTSQLVWGPLTRFMHRYLSWFLIDMGVSFAAIAITGVIWRLSAPLDLGVELAAGIALIMAFFFSLINSLMGVNRINWSRARPSDAIDLAVSNGIAILVLFVVNLLWKPRMLLPPGMLFVSCMFSFLGFISVRYRSRLITGLATRWIRWRGERATALGERVLIVGSGEVGQYATWLFRSGSLATAFSIIGMIDDDPRKSGTRIDGCQVLGNSQDIPTLVEKYDIGLIIYAIANIDPATQRQIISICHSTEARVVMMPNILTILNAQLPANQTEKDRLFSKVLHDTTIDEITGIYNRQHFMKLLKAELPRAYRYRRPISLILFTVDYIRPADATYNPAITSQLLRVAAETSNKVIREVDILGRYEDKIIALLLPETNLAGANRIVERLQTILVEQPLVTESGPMNARLHIGVASAEEETLEAETLISRAKDNMSELATAKAGML
jgi:diguanylate cyclase (GGDEF)-like protein